MADYLERKLRSDYARNGGNQGNRGNDYNKGNYNISGQYDNAGPNMYYPPMDSRPYPPTDMRNDFRGGDYNYPMDSRQGVKGTGPYGIGGSMYQGDRADFAYYPQNDMRGNDFNRGGNDYG